MPLPAAVAVATGEVVAAFRGAGIAVAVGGSVMLALNGIEVVPGDIDVIVAATDRTAATKLLPGRFESVPRHGPWRTGWLLRTGWPAAGTTVGLDVIGGLAVEIDGFVARFPLRVERTVVVEGVPIPLAPLSHWYHLYRVHDPAKATLIRSRLDPAAIAAAGAALGLRDGGITLH